MQESQPPSSTKSAAPRLDLEVIVEAPNARLPITVSDVNRPGLALAGFTENFLYERIQILGETETLYLDTLSAAERRRGGPALRAGPAVRHRLQGSARRSVSEGALRGAPGSAAAHAHVHHAVHSRQLTAYLNDVFAPRITLHGSLVDVYGVGLPFAGERHREERDRAGSRGARAPPRGGRHRDREPPAAASLVGSSNELLGLRMEIRGVGIVDIQEMFGVARHAIAQARGGGGASRALGSRSSVREARSRRPRTTSILGVRIPYVTIPLVPGKNVAVLAEVVAMNHLIKSSGRNAAVALDARLKELASSGAPYAVGDTGDAGVTWPGRRDPAATQGRQSAGSPHAGRERRSRTPPAVSRRRSR